MYMDRAVRAAEVLEVALRHHMLPYVRAIRHFCPLLFGQERFDWVSIVYAKPVRPSLEACFKSVSLREK